MSQSVRNIFCVLEGGKMRISLKCKARLNKNKIWMWFVFCIEESCSIAWKIQKALSRKSVFVAGRHFNTQNFFIFSIVCSRLFVRYSSYKIFMSRFRMIVTFFFFVLSFLTLTFSGMKYLIFARLKLLDLQ
jgi:hypothetical protein